MKKLRATLTSGAASAGLVLGMATFAGATSGSSIDTTGPDSHNSVSHSTRSHVRVQNNNHVSARNTNDQHAYSGDATVTHNTNGGGGATTGEAWNDNSMSARVSVDNSGSGAAAMSAAAMPTSSTGSISNTGPDSRNTITTTASSDVNVTNNNDLCITNNNTQHASTGDATVSNNTNGGSATTGSASNSNSTTLDLTVKN